MKEPTDEIANLDLPISRVIREALNDLPKLKQQEILGAMTKEEFIGHRVDTYLKEIETALHSGCDELGAKEIALRECLAGISADNG